MDSKLCLSLISVCTRGTYTCRFNSIFLWTLILSVFVIYPSFADNHLKNNIDVVTATPTPNGTTLFFTQAFVMPVDTTAMVDTILDCSAQNKFTDDGTSLATYPLYNDSQARLDTFTICPKNPWQTVKVEFTEFDLAIGDTLGVYNGNLEAFRDGDAPLIGSGTGVGVSKAFGGWAAAACSPAINSSGCLTFIFKTNGDNSKGNGWEAWVTCNDRNVVLTPPSIANPRLSCSNTSFVHTIGAATVTATCGTIANDSTIVRITNASGKICIDTCLSKNKNMVINREFALGNYLVTYKLKSDTTKTAQTYFSINEPNLICNDQLYVPLGSACAVQITPDMILENPCDTIQDTMYYQITVRDAFGKILASGTGKAGDYPMLDKDDIKGCQNSFKVEVTRVYFEGLDLTICNNGRQESNCTADVTFTDNSPPLFTKGITTDTVYACEPNLSATGLMLTPPTAIDNCSEVKVTFQGATQVSLGTNCEETTYLVTWVAQDDCNNTTTLKDTVRVMRPGVDKILKAPNVTLSCGEDAPNAAQNLAKTGAPSLVLGLQRNGVFTPTDTVALSTEQYICNYILQRKDQQFPSTCGEKYFRYWTLVDWCSDNGPVPIDTQLVVFKDTIAPVIHCSAYNTVETAKVISLSHFDCSKNVTLSLPTASDNCDLIPDVAMYTVERLEGKNWWTVGNNLSDAGALNTGTYRVGYRAFDQCPEQVKEDSCFQYFVLEDHTKPSAICQDQLTISISNDYARIMATDIDAGSWDACGIETVLVRRQICNAPGIWQGSVNNYVKERLANRLDPTGWSTFIDFSCCDMHQQVKVELLVIDRNGNYNFCAMTINAEDKIDPICVNLSNQWDYCDNFHTGELGVLTDRDGDRTFDNTEWVSLEGDLADLYNEKYGLPYAACIDNLTCQELSLEQEYQLIDLDCGVYKAKRRYRVRDWTGNVSNWAEQYINIEYRPDWKVTLPVDWVGSCGDGVPEAELLIENGFCDQMSYESYDQKFEIVNDACFKVIRTYHIINWCKYQAGDSPININRLSDANGDVVNTQTFTSAQYGSAAYFTYTQILKVADTDAPIVEVAAVDDCIDGVNSCSATKTFSATATDCNDASSVSLDYHWQVFENNINRGSGYTANFNWVVQPNINYKVKWQVADKCGNSAWVENVYTFKDCKKPTAYCLDGLALELGSNKEVAIWAVDFDVNSSDNCTAKEQLDFRMWHSSLPNEVPTNYAEVKALPTSVALNCAYIGLQTVYVYVIDAAGNYDFCVTTMNVQDNMGVCPVTDGSVAGKIYTEFGAAVQDAEVRIENMENVAMMTQANGNYAFNVAGSNSYTIVPRKNINFLNGVSTFDLVKITKHILGKEKFTSPYQYIAADVNASGEISTFDIIQLRKLILNLSSEFPNGNTSWRFVDASYEFVTDNPAAEVFPEFIQVNNLNGLTPDLDFIAVKIGDINGSASASSLFEAESRNKEGDMLITIADRQVKTDEIVEVAFDATDFKNIEGYQFTLQFQDLELVDFIPGVATAANIGMTLKDRGYVTTSWNNPTNHSNELTTTLFHLTFKATTSGSLSSLLQINSDFTPSEAYRNDGSLLGVALQPQRSAALFPIFGLEQNTPNPFTNSTLIGFELPEAAAIELNVIDMQGQVIQSKKGAYGKGHQKIEVRANELPNGTYYYQLVTPFGVAAKKMIVLK